MGFIVAIIFIVLSDAVYTQDFNSRTTFMKATNANSGKKITKFLLNREKREKDNASVDKWTIQYC